jgi:hypothetical protein
MFESVGSSHVNGVYSTSPNSINTETPKNDGGLHYSEHAISDTGGNLSVGIYRPETAQGRGDAFIIDDKAFALLLQNEPALKELGKLCERTNSSIVVAKYLMQETDSSDGDKIVSSLSGNDLFDKCRIHKITNPYGEFAALFSGINIAMDLKGISDKALVEKYRSCYRGLENNFVTVIVVEGQLNTILHGDLSKLIAKELAQELAKTAVGGAAWGAGSLIAGSALPGVVAGYGALILGRALHKCITQLLSSAIDRILLAYRCPFPNWTNPNTSDIEAAVKYSETPRFLPFVPYTNANHDLAGRVDNNQQQLDISTLWPGRKPAAEPRPKGTLIIRETPPILEKVTPEAKTKKNSRSKNTMLSTAGNVHKSQKDAVHSPQVGLVSQTLKVAIDYAKTPVMAVEIFANRVYDWVKAGKGIDPEKAQKLKDVVKFADEDNQRRIQEFGLICDEMAARNINTDDIQQNLPDKLTTYLSFYTDTKVTKDTVEWKAGKVSATIDNLTRLVDSMVRGDNPAKTLAIDKKYRMEQSEKALSKADAQSKEDRVKLYSAMITGSLKDDLSAQVNTMVNALKYAHKLHAEFDSGKVDQDYSRFIHKEDLQRQVEMLPKLTGMLEELDRDIEALLPGMNLAAVRNSFGETENLTTLNKKTPKTLPLNEANLEKIHNMLEKCMACCLYANEIYLEPTITRGEDVLPPGENDISATHALSEDEFADVLLPLKKTIESISANASRLAGLGLVP